jgi:signal transduction histidine kinase
MADSLEQAERRKRLEDDLRRKNYELEQQNRAVQEATRLKTEFVSVVSHELRAPLTSILGYVDLLLERERGALSDEQRDWLRVVQGNADRLLRLINELLDLSRIEAGRVDLDRASLDLAGIIRAVARSLDPLIVAKRQRLALDLADGLPPAWADADRVTQILTNLITNAHKYTPPEGRITVGARRDGGLLRVEVRDTGDGLTPEEQAQLFTRFFRSRQPGRPAIPGTGLGLVIARLLVELHGGEITVTSAPGEGSTFAFSLPLAGPAADGPPARAAGDLPAH